MTPGSIARSALGGQSTWSSLKTLIVYNSNLGKELWLVQSAALPTIVII